MFMLYAQILYILCANLRGNKHQKPHLSLFNSNAAFFIFQKIFGTPQASSLIFSASGTPLGAPGTAPPAPSGTRSNGEVKSRGPRKSLIFGDSGGLGRPAD